MYKLSEERVKYWDAFDEAAQKKDGVKPIKEHYRKVVTQVLLENQERALKGVADLGADYGEDQLSEAVNVTQGGANPLANWDPILISLVRRSMPNLMAYDTCGVQPMTGPTGLIFAMKSKYTSQGGTEALFNVADTTFSGTGTEAMAAANYYASNNATSGAAMATSQGETLGGVGTNDLDWNDMAFSIEKTSVTAKTRALKAEYTTELAQDLRSIHGLDAETELTNILSTEILTEINREIIHVIRKVAKLSNAAPKYSGGSLVVDSNGLPVTSTAGEFDINVNSDGRWQSEKFASLLMKIHREANVIARETRRGRGNFLIVSSDVAAALDLTGKLRYTPAIDDSFNYDDTGNTYVGVLSGRYKVYIDPYAAYDEIIIGYKGASAWDAGIYYCPYVPLQMVKTLDPNTFQPKVAFKTRYGIVANPFASLTGNANPYFRKFQVKNI